jgi:hypothetical protein
MEDGGRLAPVAVELVDHLATLMAVRRFHGMGATDSRPLRSDIHVHMQHFVRRSTYVPFRRCLGDVRREFMERLFVALHGTLGSYLRDALQEGSAQVLMMWHASLFLGLRFSPLFLSFCLVASVTFSCKTLF